ncbi:MAG: glycosyltransferase family 4 protein [Deltaproteobacteria bacterium]|nr:glycosyltransferase family 4 protein [Deltaproteobacteria bacterium]
MKIAINATSAVYGGGVTYLRELIKSLSLKDRENEYIVFASKEKKEVFEGFASETLSVSPIDFMGSRILRGLWEQVCLPYHLKKNHVDLLYCPANIIPLCSSVKTVLMVQNLEPFFNGRGLTRLAVLKTLSLLSARKADAIIFISDYARTLFKERYGINGKAAHTVYHGRDRRFRPTVSRNDVEAVKKELGIHGDYILYVSNLYRYKNAIELVLAFGLLEEGLRNDLRLVIAGEFPDRRYESRLRRVIETRGLSADVLLTGNLSYERLPALYSGCKVFAYPSACENCPNILIEAMASGAAIAASRLASMPEICADAALYFDPHDSLEIKDTIERLLKDPHLRIGLREKSLRRAALFSWHSTADATLRVFMENGG